MNIIGINAGSHDSSAALLKDGDIAFAISEERLDRVKHSRNFPWLSINACLKSSNLSINDIDCICIGWDYYRFVKEIYLRPAIKDISQFEYIVRDIDKLNSLLNFEALIREKLNFKGKFLSLPHHECHVAYAFFTSGFRESAFLSIDGYGEKETAILGHINQEEINIDSSIDFPNSLGLAYAAITHYLGFRHHCDEGIVMGLASYGNPFAKVPGKPFTYYSAFEEILPIDESANFKVDTDWLAIGLMKNKWVTKKFIELFGPKREPGSPLLNHHKNIAAAIQKRTEEVTCSLVRQLYKKSPSENLCLSGGVALNCVMNTKIYKLNLFKNVFIPAAPADNGVAIGAAILAQKRHFKQPLSPSISKVKIGLGKKYSEKEIIDAVKSANIKKETPVNLVNSVAAMLKEGKIVGWFQGRSEFGPRALGNRSILTRPFPAEMKDILNAKVKFREKFRPFAPIVPFEDAEKYFTPVIYSPFMMHAIDARTDVGQDFSATVHIDGTCRVQTVSKEDNPLLYDLLKAFEEITGIPILLNTSFNIKGEPIVETPSDAISCFLNTKIDILVLGSHIFRKEHI